MNPFTHASCPLVALLVFAFALPVTAAASTPARMKKIAVLEVKTTGNVDPKSVSSLSSLIASEAVRYPVKVFAGSDLQALLGFERQKQIMGCTDTSCLAEIGGAMGVDYLLFAEVGEVAGWWLLTTALLDISRATSLQRVTKTAKTLADLVPMVAGAVGETLAPVAPVPAVLAPAVKPAPADELTKKPQAAGPTKVPDAATPQVSEATDPARPYKLAGYAAIGVGAAAIVGGAVFGGLALSERSDTAAHLGSMTQAALDEHKASIVRSTQIADGLYVAGAVVAAAGIVLVAVAPSADLPKATSVGVAPLPGGGQLVLSGGF